MAKFLVCHGAWSAAWAWKKMRPLLQAAGHELFVPTYTGLGERSHLASPSIDLETHIRDVLAVLEYEDLAGLTLIGHSYGGIVATGVADRARDRIERIVYLDALVPGDGQSAFDLLPEKARDRMREAAATTGEGWRIPPNPIPPDTSPEDLEWIAPRRVAQPIGTYQQPLRLMAHTDPPPRTYIYCTRIAPGDTFGPFAMLARNDPRWRYIELDASHSPHITAPQALARVLEEIESAAS
jgi:pimeloyl-ACP methyl ester carboxylesterase